MKRKIITTADGSKTIHIEEWNEQYHSKHGAIQEANHVYLKHGLLFYLSECNTSDSVPISVLEIGFGSGLNALLTLQFAENNKTKIDYVGVEAFPVLKEELQLLNYPDQLGIDTKRFELLHQSEWESKQTISNNFQCTKQQKFFRDIHDINAYDVIYFDAFGARVQPELWTKEIFQRMYNALRPNGVMTTYAAIGEVRRLLTAIGFEVERLEGPPGKRHMIRAIKR